MSKTKKKLDRPALEKVAKVFSGFADATRLAILQELMEDTRSVGELVEAVGGSQGNVSKQLQLLFDAGLLEREKEGNQVDVTIMIDPDFPKSVWDDLPEEMIQYQTFKLDMTLTATLNNDLRSPVLITTDDVFADGAPVQGTATRELARRAQINIKLSDVSTTALSRGEPASHIVSFTSP